MNLYIYVLPSVVVVQGTAPPGEEGTLMAAVIPAGVVDPAGVVGLAGVVDPDGVVEVAGVPGQHTGAVGLEPLQVSVCLSLTFITHKCAHTHLHESQSFLSLIFSFSL